MWNAQSLTARLRRYASKQRRIRDMEDKWYAAALSRDTLVSFTISTTIVRQPDVVVAAPPDAPTTARSDSSDVESAAPDVPPAPAPPRYTVEASCQLRYTREALRFGWCIPSDEEKEAYGVVFDDPEDDAAYDAATDTVYLNTATKTFALARPVYGFWYVSPRQTNVHSRRTHTASCSCTQAILPVFSRSRRDGVSF